MVLEIIINRCPNVIWQRLIASGPSPTGLPAILVESLVVRDGTDHQARKRCCVWATTMHRADVSNDHTASWAHSSRQPKDCWLLFWKNAALADEPVVLNRRGTREMQGGPRHKSCRAILHCEACTSHSHSRKHRRELRCVPVPAIKRSAAVIVCLLELVRVTHHRVASCLTPNKQTRPC